MQSLRILCNLLTIFLIVSGCAVYKTYNQTTLGTVVFRGGVYKNKSWDDALVFKRMSWYHGMTLYFDVLLWRAGPDSPFSEWFSEDEKEFFNRCETLLVTAAYSADPDKISQINFKQQMELNGYQSVVVRQFSSSLKTHPSALDWRLKNYKFSGFCKTSPSKLDENKLAINFPSFSQLEVRP